MEGAVLVQQPLFVLIDPVQNHGYVDLFLQYLEVDRAGEGAQEVSMQTNGQILSLLKVLL